MWSKPRPAPALRPLRATIAQRQIQKVLHECDGWLDRLSAKYGVPRAVLVGMLRPRGAIEREIALWISEQATWRARELFDRDEPAPEGNDLWARAVRGVHAQLVTQRDAAEEAERRRKFAETDALLARMRAGEDVL